MGVNLPIILCANKSDLFPKSKSNLKSTNSDEFVPLINEFKEIEAGVRCSAKIIIMWWKHFIYVNEP